MLYWCSCLLRHASIVNLELDVLFYVRWLERFFNGCVLWLRMSTLCCFHTFNKNIYKFKMYNPISSLKNRNKKILHEQVVAPHWINASLSLPWCIQAIQRCNPRPFSLAAVGVPRSNSITSASLVKQCDLRNHAGRGRIAPQSNSVWFTSSIAPI